MYISADTQFLVAERRSHPAIPMRRPPRGWHSRYERLVILKLVLRMFCHHDPSSRRRPSSLPFTHFPSYSLQKLFIPIEYTHTHPMIQRPQYRHRFP